jgi:sugar lactone lactonase YvrE
MTPDQSQIIVADTRSANMFIFNIGADGSLSNKQPYFTMEIPAFKTDSGADGMTVDTQGRVYVTTHMGLQIFDQAGRVNAILPKPHRAWLSNVCFGGPANQYLYITNGDKVFRRKTKATGVLFFQGVMLPPTPRL